jgi:hypothetical protein
MEHADAEDKHRSLRWILLGAVILFGAVLRLYQLGEQSLWYDEAFTVLHDEEPDFPWICFNMPVTMEPPVFPILVGGWRALLGLFVHLDRTQAASDFLLRLLPCIMGILAIPLVFLACRVVTRNPNAAVIAAYLYALSPFEVYYAQELRNYTLYTVLCLLTLLCLLKALEEDRRRDWAVLAVLLAVLIYTHFFCVWIVAAFALYFLVTLNTHWRRLRPWILCHAAALLLVIPALVMIRIVSGYYSHMVDQWYPRPEAKTALTTFKTFFAGYSPNVAAYWTLFLLALVLFGLGVFGLRRRWNGLALLLVVSVVPVVGNVIVWNLRDVPVYELRHFVFSAVAAYALVAVGICALPRAWIAGAVLVAFTAVTVPCLGDYYAHRLHPVERHRIAVWDKVDFRDAARYVNARAAEGDVVGHPGHFTWFSFKYYSPVKQCILGHGRPERDRMARVFGTDVIPRHYGMFPEPIQTVAAEARRIWFLETRGITFDWHPSVVVLRGWLEAHGIREDYQVFDGLSVTCYRMDPDRRAGLLRDQLADLGEAPLPYYQAAIPDPGLSRAMIEAVGPTLATPWNTWGIRFELALVDPTGTILSGVRQPVAWDQGGGSVPRLAFPDLGLNLAPGESFAIGDVSYSLLAVNETSRRGLLASFPLSAAAPFSYRFTVTNATDVSREFACVVIESAAVVGSLDYLRDDPATSVWNPAPQYTMRPPQGFVIAPGITAHLRDTVGEGETIRATVSLDPGDYAAYARINKDAVGHDSVRGQATFRIGPPEQVLATLDRRDPTGAWGWSWRPLGQFHASGGPMTLAVTAHNAKRLPDAYFELDRVLFIRAPAGEGNTPFITQRFNVTLGPGAKQDLVLNGTLDGYRQKRFDIEAFEPATKVFRSLTFHVTHGAAPETAPGAVSRQEGGALPR